MPLQQNTNTVTLSHASGATATIYLFGAHVTSWKTPDGKERLYLSKRSALDGSAAIRGGIPIAWPIAFGGPSEKEVSEDPLLAPNKAVGKTGHGFARTSLWSLVDSIENEQSVDVTFRLDPKSFPPEFPVVNVEYNVTLNDKSLTTALKTSNPQDSATAIRFKMFYHNYLAVSHVQNARVSGLSEGTEYKDTVKGGELGKWGGGDISFAEKTGKIFTDVTAPEGFTIRDGKDVVKIETENLPDCFMWNPQQNAGTSVWSDMEQGDGDKFVGVEPGYLHSYKALAPGEEFVGKQTISVTASTSG